MQNGELQVQGRGIVYILRRALIRRALIIPEKRVVYVVHVSIVAYQDYQDRCRPHKKKKLEIGNCTRGTECECAQYCARG